VADAAVSDPKEHDMSTTPQEPLKDDDMETTSSVSTPADADGTDGDATDTADGDATDADGTDGGDADATDGGDADGTDA
jgi:hypothetical protein